MGSEQEDILSSFKQLNQTLEKKLRNCEKKKVKLDTYRQKPVDSLNDDQKDALTKYDSNLGAIEFGRDIQKQLEQMVSTFECDCRKKDMREKLQEQQRNHQRLFDTLAAFDILKQFTDADVQKDLKESRIGAPSDVKNLETFIELYLTLKPEYYENKQHDSQKWSYKNRIGRIADNLTSLLDGRERMFSPSPSISVSFSELHAELMLMRESQYFKLTPDEKKKLRVEEQLEKERKLKEEEEEREREKEKEKEREAETLNSQSPTTNGPEETESNIILSEMHTEGVEVEQLSKNSKPEVVGPHFKLTPSIRDFSTAEFNFLQDSLLDAENGAKGSINHVNNATTELKPPSLTGPNFNPMIIQSTLTDRFSHMEYDRRSIEAQNPMPTPPLHQTLPNPAFVPTSLLPQIEPIGTSGHALPYVDASTVSQSDLFPMNSTSDSKMFEQLQNEKIASLLPSSSANFSEMFKNVNLIPSNNDEPGLSYDLNKSDSMGMVNNLTRKQFLGENTLWGSAADVPASTNRPIAVSSGIFSNHDQSSLTKHFTNYTSTSTSLNNGTVHHSVADQKFVNPVSNYGNSNAPGNFVQNKQFSNNPGANNRGYNNRRGGSYGGPKTFRGAGGGIRGGSGRWNSSGGIRNQGARQNFADGSSFRINQ